MQTRWLSVQNRNSKVNKNNRLHQENIFENFSETYLGPYQTYMEERIWRIAGGWKLLTIYAKSSSVDSWQGPKYAFVSFISAQCSVSYRTQSFILVCKTNNWFLQETNTGLILVHQFIRCCNLLLTSWIFLTTFKISLQNHSGWL